MTDDNRSELEQLVRLAAQTADDKKGHETLIIDVGNVLAVTEFFVITSAPNSRMVRSIAESVEAEIKAIGGPSPKRIEGLRELNWVLMDYGDFIVHVFTEETRRFYDLERLWKDMPRLSWEPLVRSATPTTESED